MDERSALGLAPGREAVTCRPGTRRPGTRRLAGRAGRFARRTAGGLPRAFWVLWAGTLVNRIGVLVEPFIALYLSGARHLSLAQVGTVLASYGAGSVLSQPIGGALADRIGRRATLAAGMTANAAALIGLGYARGVGPLVAASVAAGLAVDLYRPAVSAMVADLVPAADRTRAYGLIFWAVNLGFSVAMVAGGMLARTGFTALFWIDAGTCLLFGLLVWRGVPETLPARATAAAPGRAGGSRPGPGLRVLLRDPLFGGFWLIALAGACVYMQAYTTLPLAMSAVGLPPQGYGAAMAVNGLIIVVAQPVTGAWLGRLDQTRVLAAGIACLGLGFGLIALAGSTWQYAACVAVWTAGEILTTNVSAAMVADLAPPWLRGTYSGAFGLTFALGYIIAPLAGTRLLSAGKPALWLGCAGVCALAAAGQLALGPAIRRRTGRAAAAGAAGRGSRNAAGIDSSRDLHRRRACRRAAGHADDRRRDPHQARRRALREQRLPAP